MKWKEFDEMTKKDVVHAMLLTKALDPMSLHVILR